MRSGGIKGPHLTVTLCFLRGGLRELKREQWKRGDEKQLVVTRRAAAHIRMLEKADRTVLPRSLRDGPAANASRRLLRKRSESHSAKRTVRPPTWLESWEKWYDMQVE